MVDEASEQEMRAAAAASLTIVKELGCWPCPRESAWHEESLVVPRSLRIELLEATGLSSEEASLQADALHSVTPANAF